MSRHSATVAEAVRNGTVPAPLALAVVDVVSGFVARTAGASGAVGLMQILPGTATRETGGINPRAPPLHAPLTQPPPCLSPALSRLRSRDFDRSPAFKPSSTQIARSFFLFFNAVAISPHVM